MTAPANDDFANREDLGTVSAVVAVPFTLVDSTLESGEQHTSGMAGSVWYEVQVDVDRYVRFDVPDGVEVRLYSGTTTLAGMDYEDVSNDSRRRAFELTAGTSYYLKLQSAAGTEADIMQVRPFAWTDWITPPPVQQLPGRAQRTVLGRSIADDDGVFPSTTGFPSLSDAWDFALAGPDDPDDYGIQSVGNVGMGTSWGKGSDDSGFEWAAYYGELFWVGDFASDRGPITSDTDWWAGVGDFHDFPFVYAFDYADDPVSGDEIQWDSGLPDFATGEMGAVEFDPSPHTGTVAQEEQSLDWYLNFTPPPAAYTDIPDWQTPPTSGVVDVVQYHDPAGPVNTVSGGTPSDGLTADTLAELDGSLLALYLASDATLPTAGTTQPDGSNNVSMLIRAVIRATAPIQYPRYKMYAPLASVTPPTADGWRVGSIGWAAA